MGIIIRQSVKTTIVNFIGVGIAAISTLFIYPLYADIYGFAQFLIGTAALFVPFASLGIANTVIKFYPKFETQDKSNQGMLSMLLMAFVVVYGLALVFFSIFRVPLTTWLHNIGVDKESMMPEWFTIILVITGIMILNYILIAYATSNKRIVVPQIISQLGIKIFMPVAILTFAALAVSKIQFAWWLICFYLFVSIMMILYLMYLGVFKLQKPNWQFLSTPLKGEIFQYGMFSSWNQIGSVLALRIDIVMIPMMLTWSSGGIYAMMVFLANVIEIPARAVRSIAAPIISESWEHGNIDEIKNIYKKSALNLIIPGLAILVLIWFSFDGIAGISSDPSKLLAGKYAFLFLGIGKLLDLCTSVNDQIIAYSPKYKYNLIFILVLGVVNVILNYTLIEEYGITGAAIASCIAYAVYNTIKLLFILVSYKMQPFTLPVFKVFLIGAILAGILYILPNIEFALGEIIVNGLITCLIYFPAIYFLNISPDFNKLCNIVLKKIKSFI